MQERTNIRRLILLAVSLTATVVAYFLLREENKAEVDPSLFKVEELSKIDRVELESSRGKVKLNYDGKWKVNDKYDADRQRITVLFATIEKAVPKRPVAASLRDSINKSMEAFGVKVSLYAGAELKQQFLTGGNAQKTESYFREGKSGETYIVTIPGYRVYVEQVFELGENDLRDKRIFSFNWENFKDVSVDYPADKASGFTIEKQEGIFMVKGEAKADTSRVFSFLDDISYLVADEIVNPGSSVTYDSLSKTAPVATVTIHDIANRVYSLTLFRPLTEAGPMLGKTEAHGLVLVDRKRVFRIARRKNYLIN